MTRGLLVKGGVWLALCFMSIGCSTESVSRLQSARQVVQLTQFKEEIDQQSLPVKVWSQISDPHQSVHVYIEGDGHAWNQGGRPSLDPTPRNPVALQLATADSHPNIIYLARPCQFVPLPQRSCHYSLWTEERFSPRVVARLLAVLGRRITEDQPVLLIGFSGGANIAIQMAAKLNAVEGIVTVAGNLDDRIFAAYHRLPVPQYGENRELLTGLSIVPQLHLSGRLDQIIPPQLTAQMLKEVQSSACVATQVQSGATHRGPWAIPWALFEQRRKECGKTKRANRSSPEEGG